MSSPTPTPALSAVFAWYTATVSWDFESLANLLDDTYCHKTIPAIADDGVKDKEQGLADARSIAEALGWLPMQYEIFDHIESGNRVWAHSRLYTEKDGQTLFDNESLFLFTLADDDDPKIEEIREFVDTKTLSDSDWKSQSTPAFYDIPT